MAQRLIKVSFKDDREFHGVLLAIGRLSPLTPKEFGRAAIIGMLNMLQAEASKRNELKNDNETSESSEVCSTQSEEPQEVCDTGSESGPDAGSGVEGESRIEGEAGVSGTGE